MLVAGGRELLKPADLWQEGDFFFNLCCTSWLSTFSHLYAKETMDESMSSSNDWPENLAELRNLDGLLRCGICHEYFKNCMMTKCSHNFCSLCIRRYLSTKSACPTCFQVTAEPDLLSNRALDDIVKSFVVFRKKRINVGKSSDSNMDFCTSSEHKNHVTDEVSSKYSMNVADVDAHSSKNVSCPICAQTVPFTQINIHIDTCLNGKEDQPCLNNNKDQPAKPPEKVKRAYLPKKVYKFMKEKDLRDDLKKYGINPKGNKETLVSRHKKFVIIYNADCDSEDPLPVPELVRQLELEEAAILENRSTDKDNKGFKVNCSSHPDEIDKERKAYLKQNKGHYLDLVKQAHANSEKNEIRSSSSDDAKPSTSGVSSKLIGPAKSLRSGLKRPSSSSGSFSSEDSYKLVNMPQTSRQGISKIFDNDSDSDDVNVLPSEKQPTNSPSPSGSSTEILDEDSDDLEMDQDFFDNPKSSAALRQQNINHSCARSSHMDFSRGALNSEKKRKLSDSKKDAGRSPLFRRKSEK